MSKKTLISICVASNRPFLWKGLYDSIKKDSNNIKFEIIIAGPNKADYNLPSNFKHIKTNNIKFPQCFEISLRNAQGDFIHSCADDVSFLDKGLKHLLKEHHKICDKENNNIIILPSFKVKGQYQRLRYAKKKMTPFASLNSALFDRKILSLVKGVDKNFIGVYWDCDIAMRFQEKGIKIIKSSNITSVEFTHKGCSSYLHRICKPYDKKVLDSFWIRSYKKDEDILSKEIWCQMSKNKTFLSKKRLKSFEGYKNKDLLLYSQGPKKIGDLKWM